MRTANSVLALTTAFVFAATVPAYSQAQRSSPPDVAWYMPRKERLRLYRKVELQCSASSDGFTFGYWITPPIAHALVSYSIDREKIGHDVAETRYVSLRSPDHYLVFLHIFSSPGGTSGLAARARLITQNDKDGVPGDFRKVPFRVSFMNEGGAIESDVIVAFPRVNASGARVIGDLNDEVTIKLDYAGQAIYLRSKVRRLASSLDDL